MVGCFDRKKSIIEVELTEKEKLEKQILECVGENGTFCFDLFKKLEINNKSREKKDLAIEIIAKLSREDVICLIDKKDETGNYDYFLKKMDDFDKRFINAILKCLDGCLRYENLCEKVYEFLKENDETILGEIEKIDDFSYVFENYITGLSFEEMRIVMKKEVSGRRESIFFEKKMDFLELNENDKEKFTGIILDRLADDSLKYEQLSERVYKFLSESQKDFLKKVEEKSSFEDFFNNFVNGLIKEGKIRKYDSGLLENSYKEKTELTESDIDKFKDIIVDCVGNDFCSISKLSDRVHKFLLNNEISLLEKMKKLKDFEHFDWYYTAELIKEATKIDEMINMEYNRDPRFEEGGEFGNEEFVIGPKKLCDGYIKEHPQYFSE